MKLTTLFTLMTIFQLYASDSYSQLTKITLKVENDKISDVLKKIEDKSEYYFLYSPKLINVEKRVNINVKDEPIKNILSKIFDEDVKFEIYSQQIILTKEGISKVSAIIQQKNTVTGTVTDEKGTTLPGVSIQVEGTTIGTVSDVNGKYTIDLPSESGVLIFSFIGFTEQKIAVKGGATINVTMISQAQNLQETVVIGYGTQKKVNLTGSVSSVNSKVLKTIPPTGSTTNALAGRLPGLISKQNSGSPGRDAASLSIRGFGVALVIVDGVESSFNNIDANEIESVSILKDASAAIYGARAGNGVILVTTKRGIDGKPTITANSSYSFQSITAYPERMSAGQYAEYDYEKRMHQGAQQKFTQEEIAKYYAGTDPDYPNTDWRKELIRDFAPMQQHNISVRGGSDKIKYFGLIGFMDQETFWKTNGGNFRRINIRSNIDAKITDNLSMQIDFSNINEIRKTSAREAGIDSRDLWQDYWTSYPIYPSTLPDPTKLSYTGPGGLGGAQNSSNREILGYTDNEVQDIKASTALKYNFPFIKGLSARLYLNYSQSYMNKKTMDKPGAFYTYNYKNDVYTLEGTWSPEADVKHQNDKSRMITNQFSFNYDRVFGKDHSVSALALYESIGYSSDYIQAERYHFITPAIEYLFAGSPTDQYAYGSANEMGRKSYIGRINYSFKNKYLLEATFRADASAKFSSEKRWGYFPSMSVGWKISEESFLKNTVSWIENLKLRGGISNAGYDNVGNFAYLSGYQFGRNYIYGNGIASGLTTTGLANPNLTWEKMTTYNLGLDYSLWKSRLYGEFDVFYRKRDGIIATRILSLPSTFGASLPPENLNSSNDRGFEAMAGTRFGTGDLNWDISGNISWSRSKWDHFEEPDYSTDPEKARVYQKSGQWVDRVIGYETDGLYTSQAEIDAMKFDQDLQGNTTIKPGDIRYIDTNNDGKLDWKDQVDLGKGQIPHWMFGLTTNLQYKNFDFSVLFQGAAGNNITIMNPEMANFQGEGQTITLQMFDERWSEANNDPNALFIRSGSLAQGGGFSDFYLKKAGYFRLKTLNLGYNLPKKIVKVANITNLRIFFAGTNLFTVDPLKRFGLDPESPSDSFLYYPQQRTLTFGLNLTI